MPLIPLFISMELVFVGADLLISASFKYKKQSRHG